MDIPISAIHNLQNISPDASQSFSADMSIHALLAADIALGTLSQPWRAILPSLADLETSFPLMWSSQLQDLLPSIAAAMLPKKHQLFSQHFQSFSKSFPAISRQDFTHAWLLINSRTFYDETPKTMLRPWEDRLALLPIADLFNHAAHGGCHVSFSSESYSFTTTRKHDPGEEVYISYGQHGNDYLLTEYGFIMEENVWDRVGLDEVILPRLTTQQKKSLRDRDLLGSYSLIPGDGPCGRTREALRPLCDDASETAEGTFRSLLQDMLDLSKERLAAVSALDNEHEPQKKVLEARWQQIHAHLYNAIDEE